jgi:adenylosuccinate synthase
MLILTVGGQYGGEGKGAITAALANRLSANIVVKVGGPNSSHTASHCGVNVKLRMLPAASICTRDAIVFPAGCLIEISTLLEELESVSFNGQVIIDRNAGIIEPEHWQMQKADPFYQKSGSTLTGTGMAISLRAQRRLCLAKDERRLAGFLGDTSEFLHNALVSNKSVLVEGCQSFGLCNYHGDYPYVTSRATSAGALLAQIGLGYKYLSKTILVIKAFPTRNNGGIGSLPFELDQSDIDVHLSEYGGESYGEQGKLRRVAMFDFGIVQRAMKGNTPDCVAVTGLDKLAALQGKEPFRGHYGSTEQFLRTLEERLRCPIAIQSWGPRVEDARFFNSLDL